MMQLVTFTKVVGEGRAMGYLDGRACFVAGPLPGETARVRVTRSAARFVEAELVELVERSPRRSTPAEAHYLACSPWQGVDYNYQLELKRAILAETMGRPGLELAVADMVAAPQPLGYRNKLEFALAAGADGQLALAMHVRRRTDELVMCPGGCVLGTAPMNAAAQAVVARLGGLSVGDAAVSLTVRQSVATGDCVAVVGLRMKSRRDWAQLLGSDLAGVAVVLVRPGHHYQEVWRGGDTDVVESVGGVKMAYPYGSFFQTNVPVFEQALERMMGAIPEGARMVDLYGGVGAIGLVAAAQCGAWVTGVEIDPAAVERANATAAEAGLAGYSAVATAAERLDSAALAGAEVVVVDPPRAGLDARVVAALRAAGPARIIYLSCNPVTQARDVMRLADAYTPGAVTGFDFYPGTLHLESLIVLDRR